MGVANHCAAMSRAVRLKVGAVVVKNNNIISFSWNGTPAGWPNECENKVYLNGSVTDDATFTDENGNYRLVTKPEVLHAERNALDKIARSQESSVGASLYITHAPCVECAKSIYATGISSVFFKNVYRSDAGLAFLAAAGVNVTQLE